MQATIDYVNESKANARTRLLKARDDPTIRVITVMHASHEKLPDLLPFHEVSKDDMPGDVLMRTFERQDHA